MGPSAGTKRREKKIIKRRSINSSSFNFIFLRRTAGFVSQARCLHVCMCMGVCTEESADSARVQDALRPGDSTQGLGLKFSVLSAADFFGDEDFRASSSFGL